MNKFENGIFYIFEYSETIEKTIKLLKFHNKKVLAEPLADFLAVYNPFNDFDIIIPVPLHKKRLRERGFNQVELICQKLAIKYKKPIVNDVLIRIRDTKRQFLLNRTQRIENVNNAFKIRNPTLIKDKTILLVDDILTTGQTIRECKKVLLASGAKKVFVLVLSRAIFNCDIISNMED